MAKMWGPVATPHTILNALHTDTVIAAIVRGDLFVVNAGLNVVRLPRGTQYQVPAPNAAGDIVYTSDFIRAINFDEADTVDQSRTAETNLKTYNLAANPYAIIITEGEFKFDYNPGLAMNVVTMVRLYYGAALIKTWTIHHRFDAVTNNEFAFGFVFKCSAAFAAGGLIRYTQQNNLGIDNAALQITEHSLRVYGRV